MIEKSEFGVSDIRGVLALLVPKYPLRCLNIGAVDHRITPDHEDSKR